MFKTFRNEITMNILSRQQLYTIYGDVAPHAFALTEDEKELVRKYEKKWEKQALNGEPMKRDVVVKALRDLFRIKGIKDEKTGAVKEPNVVFVEDPTHLIPAVQKAFDAAGFIEQKAESFRDHITMGRFEGSWLSFRDFLQQERGIKSVDDSLIDLMYEIGTSLIFDDIQVISEPPSQILLDDQFRPHSEEGPAILWPNGYCKYVVHGKEIIVE